MKLETDPLASPATRGPSRVKFAQPQLLNAEDWQTEQAYHRGRLARALQYLFGTGTVAGLRVEWLPETAEVRVSPGLALDPLGRLIEIVSPQCIDLRRWFAAQMPEDRAEAWLLDGDTPVMFADVFIRFAACEQGATPSIAEGPFDATDAFAPSRLRDGHEVALVPRTEVGAIRRTPPGEQPEPLPVPDTAQRLLAQTPDRDELHELILGLWRDRREDWSHGAPPPLREHLPPRAFGIDGDPTSVGRDPTSVLLARVAFEVLEPTTSVPDPRLPPAPAPIAVREPDNFIRRFVYSLGHLVAPVAQGEAG